MPFACLDNVLVINYTSQSDVPTIHIHSYTGTYLIATVEIIFYLCK